jgi:hydrogenase nickel incorporation protein HypB
MHPRILDVRAKILKKNDELAREMRSQFAENGVFVANFVSGPGAGKTELLTRTLAALNVRYRTAAVVGDLATENDARRLATSGSPVKQILTGTMCHLEADMVRGAITGWDLGDGRDLSDCDFFFIENVGNLVCPSSWDLGEDLRVLLFSVTEGEDKPLKYPTLINTADVVVMSKCDLTAAVGFDVDLAMRNIAQVRPGIEVIEVSARTGLGMAAWLGYLERRMEEKRSGRSNPIVGAGVPATADNISVAEEGEQGLAVAGSARVEQVAGV